MKLNILQPILLTVGTLAIIATFFLGTLFSLDFMDRRSRDSLRANHARSIMAALEKYHATHGAYPILPVPGSNTTELQVPLVGGWYLRAIPRDPLGAETQSRYVSFDGKAYGLLYQIPFIRTCATLLE
jgi:hypothetical protein